MLAEHSEYINHYAFQNKYSSLYGCEGRNISQKELESIKSYEEVKEVYSTLTFDNFIDLKNGKLTILEEYNENILKQNRMDLISGRYPKEDNEVVVFNVDNKYKIGDNISGKLYYKTNDNGKNNLHLNKFKFKVVGILDNKLMKYTSKDMLFAKIEKNLIPEDNKYFRVLINFKSGYENLEAETNKMVAMLGFSPEKLNDNRDISQTTSLMTNKKLDNPRFKRLVISGILFSLITMIIYSKKRIEDMKLLRIVGASKRQVILLLGAEGIVITIFSGIIGTILGFVLTDIMVKNINYTLASKELYKILPKNIHYDFYFSAYTFKIIILPIIIAFLYQVFQTNKGFAKGEKTVFEKLFDKIIRFSIIKRKKAISKISSVNFRRYLVYLIVPVILLSLPISNYVFVKNAYDKMDNKIGTSGISVEFSHRKYEINRNDYYIPEYGFTDKDILMLKKNKDIKDLFALNNTDIIYISKGGEFNDIYSKDDSKNKEYEFSLLSFDIEELNKKGIIYNKIKENSIKKEYPKIYLKDKFYIRNSNSYEKIYKNMNVGDVVTFKVPVNNLNGINYKDVKMQVAGYIDNIKLRESILSKELIAGAYLSPQEYEKVYGYIRYNSVYFNSDKSQNIIKKEVSNAIGSEFKLRSAEDEKGDGEKIVFFEIYINMAYTIIVSIFSIFSSLRIIFSMRKNENKIVNYVGASKNTIRKMYISEGIKYGIISSLTTLSIIMYHILEEYLYLKNVFNNTVLYINYNMVILFSIIPFIIFFVCYYMATSDRTNMGS